MKKHLILLLCLVSLAGCRQTSSPGSREVVVYCALDQIYSEPILQDFEKSTGIKVKPKYDLEATKTSGLVNQIIMERQHPQCDVFWNNEILQTAVLARLGSLQPYTSPAAADIPAKFKDPRSLWTGFAARVRVIVYNPKKLGTRTPPSSVKELADPKWKGEQAMAMPLFGTTLTQWVALDQSLGSQQASSLLKDALACGLKLVDGNAVVKDRVVAGVHTWGITDTDDANSAKEDGAQIVMVIPDQQEGQMGALVIPNTVCILKGSPHPQEARMLVDFLLSHEVESRLSQGRSMQIPLHADMKRPDGVPDIAKLKVMEVDYDLAAQNFTEVLNRLREVVTPEEFDS